MENEFERMAQEADEARQRDIIDALNIEDPEERERALSAIAERAEMSREQLKQVLEDTEKFLEAERQRKREQV